MENKKGWSWIGFLFAPHYYAGYGQLKKGLLLAVISGIMPLVAVAVGIYGGLKARKELPIKEVAFNWKNVAFTSITLIVVSLISLTVISGMKGNSSGSVESSSTGESVSGNGQAMPLTEENMKVYTEKAIEMMKDILNVDDVSSGVTQMLSLEDHKKIAKGILEDMGYDYDATILAKIKEDFKSGKESEDDFFIPTSDVEEAVKIGFITSDTAKKLELFYKYQSTPDIKETVKLCEVVIECEKQGNGTCYAPKLQGLLKANFPNIVNKGNIEDYSGVFGLYDPTHGMGTQTTALFRSSNGIFDSPSAEGSFGSDNQDIKITLNRQAYDKLKNDVELVWWQ